MNNLIQIIKGEDKNNFPWDKLISLISVIIALLTVFVGLWVNSGNNKVQLKMKEYEITYLEKRKSYTSLVKYSNEFYDINKIIMEKGHLQNEMKNFKKLNLKQLDTLITALHKSKQNMLDFTTDIISFLQKPQKDNVDNHTRKFLIVYDHLIKSYRLKMDTLKQQGKNSMIVFRNSNIDSSVQNYNQIYKMFYNYRKDTLYQLLFPGDQDLNTQEEELISKFIYYLNQFLTLQILKF